MKNNNDNHRQSIKYDSEDFKIVASKAVYCHQNKAFHEAIEIKLFCQGRSMLMIDSDVIVAHSGDITIANPYEIHTNIVNDAYVGEYCLLVVDLDFFSDAGIRDIDLRQILLVKRKKFNHHIRNNEQLGKLILRIYDEIEQKKEYYRIIVANLLCELFVLLLRDEISENDELSSNQIENPHHNDIIAPALQKIFSDYSGSITIDELSSLCNISKYHFCRVFKERTGQTVTQYITNYRISLADSMLKDENLSIRNVAEMCGFGDISYFYQCYKRVKGTSPNKARKHCD